MSKFVKPDNTKECKYIEYTESKEVPYKTCDPTYIKKPKQHLEHKKKCLLPDISTMLPPENHNHNLV